MARTQYNLVGYGQLVDSDKLPRYLRARSEKNKHRHISWLTTTLLLISGLSNVLLFYKVSRQCNIGPISRSQYGKPFPLPVSFCLLT